MESNVQQRGSVKFPQFIGERVYMQEFTKQGGLPKDLERWQPTIDSMLDGIDAKGPIFVMIDQSEVKSNEQHRRGGVHVDGNWIKELRAWGGGGRWSMSEGNQGLILATDVMASYAYIGSYDDVPQNGGDCSHIDVSGMERADIEPRKVWAGDALTFLHESIPVVSDCQRTLVRLSVAGWIPNIN